MLLTRGGCSQGTLPPLPARVTADWPWLGEEEHLREGDSKGDWVRSNPGKERPVNIRDPELLTLQVVATLTVPLRQGGFCGFRDLCLQEAAASGLGSWAMQLHKQDAQDTWQEEHRHRVGPCASVHSPGDCPKSANSQMQTLDFPCHDVGSDHSRSF